MAEEAEPRGSPQAPGGSPPLAAPPSPHQGAPPEPEEGGSPPELPPLRAALEAALLREPGEATPPELGPLLGLPLPPPAKCRHLDGVRLLRDNLRLAAGGDPPSGLGGLRTALSILEKYGRNLLQPRPPRHWRGVRFGNPVFRSTVGAIRGGRGVLRLLGYTEETGEGLSFPPGQGAPHGPRVAAVTADVLLLRAELDLLLANQHPNPQFFTDILAGGGEELLVPDSLPIRAGGGPTGGTPPGSSPPRGELSSSLPPWPHQTCQRPTSVGQPHGATGLPPASGGPPPTSAGQPPSSMPLPPTSAGRSPMPKGQPPGAVGQPPASVGQPPGSGDSGGWACASCTFLNPGPSVLCEVCERPRLARRPPPAPQGWQCPHCTYWNRRRPGGGCEVCHRGGGTAPPPQPAQGPGRGGEPPPTPRSPPRIPGAAAAAAAGGGRRVVAIVRRRRRRGSGGGGGGGGAGAGPPGGAGGGAGAGGAGGGAGGAGGAAERRGEAEAGGPWGPCPCGRPPAPGPAPRATPARPAGRHGPPPPAAAGAGGAGVRGAGGGGGALYQNGGDAWGALGDLQRRRLQPFLRRLWDPQQPPLDFPEPRPAGACAVVRRALATLGVASWGRAVLVASLGRELGLGPRALGELVEAVGLCPDRAALRRRLRCECAVCGGGLPRQQMQWLTGCECPLCPECFRLHFTIGVKERGVRDLVCPACGKPDLGDEGQRLCYFSTLDTQLRQCLDPDTYQLFTQKLTELELLRDPKFLWCIQCSFGFIFEAEQGPAQCPQCQQRFCPRCQRPWDPQHASLSCAEFGAWLGARDPQAAPVGLAAFLREHGIACPRCGVWFALARGGCLHCQCSQCRHHFCCACGHPFHPKDRCPEEGCPLRGSLHGHHPRDCLFYLRDWEPPRLQRLLREGGVPFDTEPPAEAQPVPGGGCGVLEQKETGAGLRDEPCGRDIPPGHAGLCRGHYTEYLVGLINEHGLDPARLYSRAELRAAAERHLPAGRPPRDPAESEADYDRRLRRLLETEAPLATPPRR
ncbi:E3 ubiquitin-protein ligase RNF31 [Larus michahellis]|uniref:E3 ubiquitin-protein ligase RNF31 n=1 Tax=Larus michahellis TaxID=119627 RepID=UPI003D9BE561